MKNFHNISTSDFHPISFGDIYLYSEYNKIKNFLISKNKNDLLDVLGVPNYKNNLIEWNANSNNNIKNLKDHNIEQQQIILSKYNKFLNSYKSFISTLETSKNEDNKNWGALLFSLIEGSGNELFYDGDKIFMTWGWKLIDENSKKLIPTYKPKNEIELEQDKSNIKEKIEDIIEPNQIPSNNNFQDKLYLEDKKNSILDRFYLFLKKLWWLIPLFSTIILILVLFRSCNDNPCLGLHNQIDNIEYLLNNCDCKELVPCNTSSRSGNSGVTKTAHLLGQTSGTITINYDMKDIPDKIEVYYENNIVCSSYDITGNDNGFVGEMNGAGCCGSISFYYPATGNTSCVVVITGNHVDTGWDYILGCPK